MPVYVQHATLGQVGDVFNADALWHPPGLALFARRPLLRDLLERAPREHRGRAATRCFSHITLLLPQDDVDDDRHLTRGARARELADALAALHRKDFGDLLGEDEVRYRVQGNATLAAGEVQVMFGHAVYLPAVGETAACTVSVSRDGAAWTPVCAVYGGQRLALLGGDPLRATQAVPGWPFAPDCAILLINDGPDAPLDVQVRPKEALDCRFDPAQGCHVIRARGADAKAPGPRLLLRLHSAMPAAAPRPPTVWKARASGEQTAAPGVAAAEAGVADLTYAPLARQRLVLAALALPRLSRYRQTGATALDVPLAALAGDNTEGLPPHLAVGADDQLHAVTADGRLALQAPTAFSGANGTTFALTPAAAPLADRYLALLRLPDGPAHTLPPDGHCVFGRGDPALAALRVLDRPGCLRLTHGASGGADRLGLSRQACEIRIDAGDCRVRRLSPNQALYHLDAQFGFVAQLGDEAITLPRGHHLVAGHYVLRCDA